MKQHVQQLIQKYTEGRLSLEEQIELSEMIADKNNKTVEQILDEDWTLFLKSGKEPFHNQKILLDHIHHIIGLKGKDVVRQTNWWHIFQRVAAILILPLLFSFLFYYIHQNKPDKPTEINSYAEIQCPLGARIKFQLPDGTTGYLNSGARLKYPVKFDQERKAELVGEAFFDVVHNEKMPFHLNTPNLDIKDMGTSFNVVANEGEQTEEVVLQSGKIDILTKQGNIVTTMDPNERLTLNIGEKTFSIKEVEATQYSTWKDGKLVFRNENMQQLAKRLSRWYNADVVVEDDMLNDYTFHATFIDEPLDEVLKLISLTSPINYKEEKRISNKEGVYQKKKITLRIDQSKIKDFK